MNNKNASCHHRRSIRLKHYDYSQAGAYFLTICLKNRHCLFGKIEDGAMRLSFIGGIALACWEQIPEHFSNIELDQYVIMPNHMHGILVICSDLTGRGVQSNAPTRNPRDRYSKMSPRRGTISVIVRTYKAAVTTQCRKNNMSHFAWQRNYYEHIIRNEQSLYRLQEYIMNNPKKWEIDQLHPNNPSTW